MMTSWMCPYRSCKSRIASSDCTRSARVSPMPIRMPVVSGTPCSPASRMVSKPHRRILVGRSEMRAAALAQAPRYALQHDALRNRHLAQRRDLIRVEHAWIDVRQEAGLLEHRAGGLREIRDRRGMAQPREFVARCGVAQLRLVAEREQRLLAARPDAGRRDRQHLVEREIGIVAPARRLRERAVVADVAAKPGQRDEHLARIGNQRAVGRVPACRRRLGSAHRDHRIHRAPAPLQGSNGQAERGPWPQPKGNWCGAKRWND